MSAIHQALQGLSGIVTPEIEYFLVAGGGAGGSGQSFFGSGGGGGAGGVVTGTLTVTPRQQVSYRVGGQKTGAAGGAGSNSTLDGVTAYGGGDGANKQDVVAAGNGGSGGGAISVLTTPGTGVAGQGYDGGVALSTSLAGYGGGAGGAASNSGGVMIAGPGIVLGWAAFGGTYAKGGTIRSVPSIPIDYIANSGNGGCGGGNSSGLTSAESGSEGVLIIRYPDRFMPLYSYTYFATAQEVRAGGYWHYKFTAPNQDLTFTI